MLYVQNTNFATARIFCVLSEKPARNNSFYVIYSYACTRVCEIVCVSMCDCLCVIVCVCDCLCV